VIAGQKKDHACVLPCPPRACLAMTATSGRLLRTRAGVHAPPSWYTVREAINVVGFFAWIAAPASKPPSGSSFLKLAMHRRGRMRHQMATRRQREEEATDSSEDSPRMWRDGEQ
jgi:hypothetical protein